MKKFISLVTVFMISIATFLQPFAHADTNKKVYPAVTITIPSKNGNLEQAFRDYVKDVSDMYFSEGYDLNKYYYRASTIKHEWDKGFFVKNNPYSTYKFDGESAEYNKYAILDSLVQGLQTKADRMSEIGIEEYFVGFTFNIASGAWEYDNIKMLDQQIYNNQINATINEVLRETEADLINSLVDLAAAFVFKGNAPDQFNDLVDTITGIIAEAMKSRTRSMHENINAILNNELRDAMKSAFLCVNDNLDEQLLEALKSERDMLQGKTLNKEEALRYEQILYLLNAIHEADSNTLSNDLKTAAENAADNLMDEVGLVIHPTLSAEEIDKIMIRDIAVACAKELTKWIISALDCSDIPESILQSATASTVEFVVNSFNNYEVIVYDHNNDGAYSCVDIGISLLRCYFTKENLTEIADAFIQSLIKNGINKEYKELELLYLNALGNWSDICDEYVDKLPTESPQEVNKMLDEIAKAKESISKSEKMLSEVKHQSNAVNMGSVEAFLKDIITLCSDLLAICKEASGLGDIADNEIFFASIACSMYHIMERAESMRNHVKSKYSSYRNHSTIDKANIDDLKDFINCVYAIFELDKTGHKYYTDLLAGWAYQSSGKKLEDAEDEIMDLYVNLVDAWGGWGYVAVAFCGPVYDTIYYWAGSSKSEYLKEVNENDAWIESSIAVAVYLQMSNCANQAEMPSVYSGL